ncbi:MAG: antitoxin VapB family protein [Dermatophilaceae bacterium]
MAVKTITIDLEAYERLSRLKDGDSFSQVIKKYLPAPGASARDLLAALEGLEPEDRVSEETLAEVATVIAGRQNDAVRVPTW